MRERGHSESRDCHIRLTRHPLTDPQRLYGVVASQYTAASSILASPLNTASGSSCACGAAAYRRWIPFTSIEAMSSTAQFSESVRQPQACHEALSLTFISASCTLPLPDLPRSTSHHALHPSAIHFRGHFDGSDNDDNPYPAQKA